MNVASKKSRKFTEWEGADLSPTWSPDGSQIAFTSDRSGTLQIWIMNADGSDPKPLLDENVASQEPDWR